MDPASAFAVTIVAGIGLHEEASAPGDGSTTDDSGNSEGVVVDQNPSTRFVAANIVMPVVAYNGVRPTRSQEYRKADHHGCDIMFQRDGERDSNFPAGTPNGSRMFFMPDDQWAVAAAPGAIWSTGVGPTGIYVVIDHGAPYATFYVHFDALDPAIPMGIQRGAGKLQVARGQRLGRIGFSPRDGAKLKHLHIEVWKGGASESHVDPWPFLVGAPVLTMARNKVGSKVAISSLLDKVSVQENEA